MDDTPFKIEGHRWDQVLHVENRSYLSLPYWTPQAVTWEGFDFKRTPETCWFSLVGVLGLSVDVFCRKKPSEEGVTFGSPRAFRNGAAEAGRDSVRPLPEKLWEGRHQWELTDPEQAASFLRLLEHHCIRS